MILKIFSPKKLRKNGVFVDLFKIPLFFAKKINHNIGLSEKTPIFSPKWAKIAENGRKWAKIAENCGHNIDPYSFVRGKSKNCDVFADGNNFAFFSRLKSSSALQK
jgi:hypothetical protein